MDGASFRLPTRTWRFVATNLVTTLRPFLLTSVIFSLADFAAPLTRTSRYRAECLPTLTVTTRAEARVIVLVAAAGAVRAVGTGVETATGAAVTTGAVAVPPPAGVPPELP